MKIIQMYLDEDYNEIPVIIVNPPENFGLLVLQWKKLDDQFADSGGQNQPSGWAPFSEWMQKHGVTIVDAEIDNLSNY